MPARTIGCASYSTASAITNATNLEAIRVVADSWNDEPRAVDAFQDRDDVDGEDPDPREDEKQAQHASQTERRQADDARDEDIGEEQDQLRDHQHDAVLRVPLHLGILLLHEERHE